MANSSDIDPDLLATVGHAAAAVYAGSFARDTVTWAFAKLAEDSLDHLFSDSSSRERYVEWLAREAPLLQPDDDGEHGLYLVDLELGQDGRCSVVARPPKGQFILVAQHQKFELVMASYYTALAPRPAQEGVCLAHFEGDPQLAARWALGLGAWLEGQRRERNAAPPGNMVWTPAAPTAN